MAYMLSAELAATAPACEAGSLHGARVIDVGDTLDGFYDEINAALGAGTITEIGGHAFLTIDQLQAAANLVLEHDGLTPAGDPWRLPGSAQYCAGQAEQQSAAVRRVTTRLGESGCPQVMVRVGARA